ncbi:MAG: Ig-like domain-containing protein [Burkholderiaceae bacterium]
MTRLLRFNTFPGAWLPALLAVLVAGCSGGTDPILGAPGVSVRPSVTSTVPAATSPVVSGVATSSDVRATFSKPISAATVTATSFTLACPTGSAVAAAVTYDAATNTAILTPNAALPANTLCSATLSTSVTDTTGVALALPFTWSFQTAASGDVTRPSVIVTVPVNAAAATPPNTRITAAFSEDMAPASLSATTFKLTNTTLGTAVVGTVNYSVASRTATFTPTTSPLASNTLFTATITSAATDLAGNGLAGDASMLPAASDHVWTFTTSAIGDVTAPTILSVNPADTSVGNCLTKTLTASFSEAMDPTTINAATFSVTAGGVAVPGTVSYDAVAMLATFVPTDAAGFAPSTTFVATITTGATDLAGNPLAMAKVWSFSTGTQACTPAVALGGAATFGAFGGGAGVTNQGINTVVQGDLGTTAACTLVTGFHDSLHVYTQTPLNVGAVNGAINCAPPAPGTPATMAIATQARADAQAAYNALAAMPPGSDPGAGQLGGQTLLPGTYTSALGTFDITTGDLVLDAQGDANATWVFQSASALTVGLPATPRHVMLINGARAANVFWQVGSAARIETGSLMVGTIIAPAGVTISTAGQTIQTTLVGRAIGLTASVTLVNTTIVAP